MICYVKNLLHLLLGKASLNYPRLAHMHVHVTVVTSVAIQESWEPLEFLKTNDEVRAKMARQKEAS
eukprot:7833613-Ditylum_brightwellii.AAC.1